MDTTLSNLILYLLIPLIGAVRRTSDYFTTTTAASIVVAGNWAVFNSKRSRW